MIRMIYSKYEEIGRANFKWKVTLPNIVYPEHAKVRKNLKFGPYISKPMS